MASLCLLAAGGCGGIAAQSRNAEGVRLYEQGRYQEAVQQFQWAVNTDPQNADGYYNLAAVYHRLGALRNDRSQLAQAEQYYNQCLDWDENHRHCHRGLAVLLVQQGRRDEAVRLIKGWADRNPTSAEPKIELARLCEEFQEPEAAKELLVDALSADPGNARALAALGHLRERSGEQALALNDYRQSLWCNRFQPELAARVAALQSGLSPGSLPLRTPRGDTRIAAGNTIPLR